MAAEPQHNLPDLASRPETTRAAQQIVRLIERRSLKAGDQLPAQEALRTSTGFSNNSLGAAMQVLVASGLVTRKPGVGTLVRDPRRPVRGLWRIGLALLPATASQPFYGELFHRVQSHLHQAGCVSFVYILNEQRAEEPFRLEHFDHLDQDLRRGRLDGVVAMSMLDLGEWTRRQGLAIIHTGSWEFAPAGVVIDQREMTRQAVHTLAQHGCRRVGIVNQSGFVSDKARFWSGFVKAAGELGLPGSPGLVLHGGGGPVGGSHVARQLLAMPNADRPDGLVVLDDRIGTGLAATLVQSDYRPRIAAQTNLQAPLAFALPVLHFEVDVEEIAARGAQQLLSYLRNPARPLERQWVSPRMIEQAPSHMLWDSPAQPGPAHVV